MLKRIVLLLALGAALVGCSGSGGTTSTSGAGESVAPVESGAASEMPSDSGLEASPSAS
jgi:hypothetical protein